MINDGHGLRDVFSVAELIKILCSYFCQRGCNVTDPALQTTVDRVVIDTDFERLAFMLKVLKTSKVDTFKKENLDCVRVPLRKIWGNKA